MLANGKADSRRTEEAIENLSIQDLDMYSQISKRIHKEDVFSIVNTSFMPYGIESDQYSIVGEIKEVEEITNSISGENLYSMEIECNDLHFRVVINKNDLLGERQLTSFHKFTMRMRFEQFISKRQYKKGAQLTQAPLSLL